MNILLLDRYITLFFNGSQSLYVDGLAWYVTQTSTWLPLILVLLYMVIKNNDLSGVFRVVIGIALCILLADQVASSIFKPLVARWRPTNDPNIMYMVDVVRGYRGGSYGFFSSHAANTMAVATFLALLVRNKQFTFWVYSWSFFNCWSRIYLGVHYFGDLLVGCLWGGFVGWMVYRFIIRKYEAKLQQQNYLCQEVATNLSVEPSLSGYSSRSVHCFIAALWLTYFYIIFRALFFQG